MTDIDERIEELMSYGGVKKDVTVLLVSAVALIASLSVPSDTVPFDPAWIAIILCGIPILIESAVGLLIRFDIKADLMVSIALVASVIIGEYFAAGEVALIMMIGALLEDYTSERAHRGIRKLIDMRPKTARVIRDDIEIIIPATEVKVGDIVKVIAGESVPVDGVITSGATSLDQSMMTGEPIPVDRTVGDEVMSGTVNQFGVFEMRATRIEEDSSIERMIRLVEQADSDKAPMVRIADRWASWFVLISLTAAILTFLITGEIVRAVTVLIVFCPCAFILATPTAIVAAMGNSARHGLLVRSGAVMENVSKVDTITFDKTGTLTYGAPIVSEVKSLSELSDDDIFRLCAAAEKESEHPIGKAIVRSYEGDIQEPKDFVMVPGRGASCIIHDRRVIVGNRPMMTENGISMDPVGDGILNRGGIAVFVSVDGVLSGFVMLEDSVKADSDTVVGDLQSLGIEPVLMTGDNGYAAETVAEKAGIDNVISDCLPEDKLEKIRELQSDGRTVCMVGDGVNDAPALRRSDIGISMGGIGSDIAIEASDITLMDDDIRQLPHLFALSRKMMRTINTNILLSMILNITAVLLAAAGILGPITGALVHNVGSVFVVVNSAILLGWRSVFDKRTISERSDMHSSPRRSSEKSVLDLS